MEKQVILKSSAFGGFDKKSVFEYISELSESTEQAQQELTAQLGAAVSAREALEKSLRDAQNNLQRVEEDCYNATTALTAEKKRASELTSTLEKLKDEIARQELVITAKEEQIQQYLSENAELLEKNKLLESEKQRIDKASAQIGRMQLDARTDAEKLREDARIDAENMRAAARIDAEELSEKTHSEVQKLLKNAQHDADQMVNKALADADERMTEAEQKAKVLLEAAKEQAETLTGRADRSFAAVRLQMADLRGEFTAIQQSMLDAVNEMQHKMTAIGDAMQEAEQELSADYTPSGTLEFTDEPETEPTSTQEQPQREDDESARREGNFFRSAAEI